MRKTTGDPLVGTTVAHYDVEARLGGGGMGIVYAARDTRLGRRVALKFLPPLWSHDESAKQRFIREAQAASATDHPNICTIHDIGTAADGQLFIVMAHYDGQTLKERLEAGRLSVDEAVDIAAQVAEGLAKAHAQGVVHRDIKPGNLMLTENGVKILDFGLAKFADARLKLTMEGSTLGTVAYMSPEQARGEEADVRSDVWAVGVVLYEMLTGGVPFKGGYPEAISHAIRNDPPASIRAVVPEISDALEQLVFRALHKEPAIRLQSARELARALRQLQGRTIPVDLRTEPVPAPQPAVPLPPARPRRWRSGRFMGVAAAVAAVLVGAPLWMFSPVDRVPVAIAPVINQTGYAELDLYRLALTREVIAQLSESRLVRVLPYERVLPLLRRFRQGGGDVSSREALQALTAQSGARVLVIPTLLYEDGGWRARVEVRDAGTSTNIATYNLDGVVSSLMKDAVYGLMPSVAARVERHFVENGPRRVALANALLAMTGRTAPLSLPRALTLDAAAEFERGLDAYQQQEYAVALQHFTAAADRDDRDPLFLAWRARAARLVRLDSDAAAAAERAAGLLTGQTPRADRLLVEAITAEVRRDLPTAQARYEELAAAFEDEPGWLMELAAFLDRTANSAEGTTRAINTYLQALRVDERLTRANLELCRLFGPVRQNERVQAREHGQKALSDSRVTGDRVGEAHALLCLTEVLRFGNEPDRRQAQENAEAASTIFASLGSEYNASRAMLNVALGAAARGSFREAEELFGRALEAARRGSNRVLEPLLLMNLGAANVYLGDRLEASRYYRNSSELYEALGDEQRAAHQQANSAALLIEYGDEPAAALRDVQNALAVFQKLGEKNLEAFSLQVIAAYHRQTGRHTEAELNLNRALAIIRERNLDDDFDSVTVDLARSQIETGRYESARMLLTKVAANDESRSQDSALIHLARIRASLGDPDGAETELARASDAGEDNELAPLFHLTSGQVAYTTGDFAAARAAFERAAAPWTGSLPDAASVEARAWIGLMDALNGRPAGGVQIRSSLEQAERMERPALAARCRVFLAEIAVRQQRPHEALMLLNLVPPDDDGRTIGPELRAHVHYWRGVALTATGDGAGARPDLANARRILNELASSLAEADRPTFLARPDVRRILG